MLNSNVLSNKKVKNIKIKNTNMTITRPANIVLNIIMILVCIACVYPFLLVLGVSFTDNHAVELHGFHMIPQKFSLGAYAFAFKEPEVILRAYGVTIFVTIFGSLLSLIIITLYAYVISRKDFKYRNIFSFLVFFTMLFNGGLVPWYMVYSKVLGIKDTIFALILPYLVTPLYVLIMRTFFVTTIPEEIIESAKIDGAGQFRTFYQIVLPLAKPSLATIGLFDVLQYWNDWYSPLLFIENTKLFNLQYLMYKLNQNILFLATNQNATNYVTQSQQLPTQTATMATAIIVIGPIILAYPFFQQYFVEGLTVGAVKG
ncbi:MAG: carbohydrate ABC transporter permease [Bacillota bacterium]|nr:carbohydrate ABC transporter permease [Bacillota bacterium]